MRHEQFNGVIKEFLVTSSVFRHKDKFGLCFDAVVAVCIHRMEHGEPPFDALAGLQNEI